MTDLSVYDRWATIPDEISPDDALMALRTLKDVSDLEVAHAQADDILCALLRRLGHTSIVEAWDEVGKWYA